MVRVAWKPDISAFAAGANLDFSRYLDWVSQNFLAGDVWSMRRVVAAVDLIVHKWPHLDILEISDEDNITALFGKMLRAETSLRRFRRYVRGRWNQNGELSANELSYHHNVDGESSNFDKPISRDDKFGLVIYLSAPWLFSGIEDWLAPHATIISRTSANQTPFSNTANVKTIKDVDQIDNRKAVQMTFKEPRARKHLRDYNIVLVSIPSSSRVAIQADDLDEINRQSQLSDLDVRIQAAIGNSTGQTYQFIHLSQVRAASIPAQSIVISTIEAEEPLLKTINEHDQGFLKIITDRASKVLWITNAGLMSGSNPDLSLVLGFSRALMLEQPSIRFSVFDVGNTTGDHDMTVRNIDFSLSHLIQEGTELEWAQNDWSLHVSRWEPDEDLNANFRARQNRELLDIPLEEAGRCRLHIQQPGILDTIHFEKDDFEEELQPDYVELEVRSVGINAKDLYVLTAKVDTANASCSCECAGVITRVGTNINDLTPGDHVVAMASGHFATHERLPRWAVCKMRAHEQFTTMSTVPIIFSTALYALKYRANLQPGESILIHSAAGGVGIAAMQLAKHMGAEIFATVGNESKRAFLIEHFALDPNRIFSSRDAKFVPTILSATAGEGVDVVLNSLTGDLLHASLEVCAKFGRFIEIGKRDIIDHGNLDMAAFKRNVSFIACDLSNLYLSHKSNHHKQWQMLLKESLELIRHGIAQPCWPLQVFDSSEVVAAFRAFSLGTRIGKVAVSFEDNKSLLKVVNSGYATALHAHKSYLMIGCLGGLGRSLSKWMMSRGARHFVFLSRSGLDKPAGDLLVRDIIQQGANVEVLRGDVTKYEDVERAIKAAKLPIGGVIQAAMGLSESLWSSMSNDSWHASVRPKVQGTWNLHGALHVDNRDSQLDFFLMTSSVSGTVGAATESNYCAANAFLDSFARYRNSLGLPAVSVGLGMISEVGYLHEHPEIEKLMQRKGIHAINEDELLQIIDLALQNQDPKTWKPHYDKFANSHLLTGVEFTGLENQRERGFEGDNHVSADPRASRFAAAFARSTNVVDQGTSGVTNGLPADIAEALRHGNSKILHEHVRAVVAKKVSNLILLPVEQLRPEQELGDFGLDSMLAAEFRSFIFHVFEVDIPFVTLLEKSTSVEYLATLIGDELRARTKNI